MQRIYFDNNATTALDPRVLKAMLADYNGPPSNPSSMHWFGEQARIKLSTARQVCAAFFQAKPHEITFTSGGTESINFMLKGLHPKGHLITSTIEHSAMYRTMQSLQTQGMAITYLPVNTWGAPLPEQVESAIRSDTVAIALTAANGETGVKLDVETIAHIAEKKGIPLLLDYVAHVGKEPLVMHPGISAIAISGHKFHAPKGSGLLFHRAPLKLHPLITGGGQESNLRAGTENLADILGLAEALKILMEDQSSITYHLKHLRDTFEKGVQAQINNVNINGEGPRVSNVSNLAFPQIDGETLLIQLDLAGIAAAHGSACSSGALEPSRVLSQMGIDRKKAKSSLRFSFSRLNTLEEVHRAIATLSNIVCQIK